MGQRPKVFPSEQIRTGDEGQRGAVREGEDGGCAGGNFDLVGYAILLVAKTVHHGFAGGLLEHTLSVVKFCDYMVGAYPILNKDLLFTAAICHDIGKTKELSSFPENDYTDEGQLLGHIVIGVEMIGDAVRNIPDFPEKLANELKHCIVAHHGELEYGSPKKPALMEAAALNMADNTDVIAFGMSFQYIKNGVTVREEPMSCENDLVMSAEELAGSFSMLFDCNYLSTSCNKLIRRSILIDNFLRFDSRLTNYFLSDFCLLSAALRR